MKRILLATLILLPCLAIFNESDSFFPNVLGFAYIGLLALLAKTRIGMLFILNLTRAVSKVLQKL